MSYLLNADLDRLLMKETGCSPSSPLSRHPKRLINDDGGASGFVGKRQKFEDDILIRNSIMDLVTIRGVTKTA